ncbi:ATP-binding protein [Clostridium thermosuccinogenes]|uniref:ATP-binding protein n=1 Tax=Clostridium thermosuccinogenes TaxID=84032 RepID=A0A2K2FIF1_9CLOT|nr:ATP-binding protein [Pseudoclostridium thermosuccinogenes]PNT92981.1 ATP-binding protein [Pseudoclostridium thermosuccinogenes]PNT98559.1 ATP-binding protein [Pseudoclostridium thermosuccinogenes]PNU00661.1 ATP-binding protein [Pseudoclostridium thermosuccinogenes]
MMDQAEKLRKIIEGLRIKRTENQVEKRVIPQKKKARVITVTSGKGGVGKTNISINLSISLGRLGYKVLIIDADFGLANIDVLFGVIPKYSLADVIRGEKNIYEVLSDGPEGIKFISGGSGVEELAKLDKEQLDNFIENVSLLDEEFDIILIDTGAGLSDSVMKFVMAADEVLLVVTPEPTSVTDAYALIKMISRRDSSKIIKLIINRAENLEEANQIIDKITMVTSKFLAMKLFSLGYVLQDEAVSKAVKQQQPLVMAYPRSHAARLIMEMSSRLAGVDQEAAVKNVSGMRSFVSKLVSFLNN